MSTIAIITARGGSKRIPKKNIKDFCGKPIIAYSIEAALDSKSFDEVMVSTDSEEIAEIAKRYGARVPFMRSEKTSSDYATTRDVILEVLDNYKSRGLYFDEVVCIYPTAPFINGEILNTAIKSLRNNNASMLVPVVRFSYPPQRAYIIVDNQLVFKNEEYRNARSQDLEPLYHDAGQFYCYKTKDYLENNGIIKDNVTSLILPETLVQDIDNYDDWKIAELKFKLMRGLL